MLVRKSLKRFKFEKSLLTWLYSVHLLSCYYSSLSLLASGSTHIMYCSECNMHYNGRDKYWAQHEVNRPRGGGSVDRAPDSQRTNASSKLERRKYSFITVLINSSWTVLYYSYCTLHESLLVYCTASSYRLVTESMIIMQIRAHPYISLSKLNFDKPIDSLRGNLLCTHYWLNKLHLRTPYNTVQ